MIPASIPWLFRIHDLRLVSIYSHRVKTMGRVAPSAAMRVRHIVDAHPLHVVEQVRWISAKIGNYSISNNPKLLDHIIITDIRPHQALHPEFEQTLRISLRVTVLSRDSTSSCFSTLSFTDSRILHSPALPPTPPHHAGPPLRTPCLTLSPCFSSCVIAVCSILPI
jgi:hypothetical protein